MTDANLPTVDYLRQRLRYDPDTGKLAWLDCGAMPKQLRASYVDAFTARGGSGYLHGKLDGRSLLAHRVAWALHYGQWPAARIVHVNGVYTDNRIENLRLADERDVQHRGKNTSGIVGISFDKARGQWKAQFQARGVIHRVGAYRTLKEAASALAEARELVSGSSKGGQ